MVDRDSTYLKEAGNSSVFYSETSLTHLQLYILGVDINQNTSIMTLSATNKTFYLNNLKSSLIRHRFGAQRGFHTWQPVGSVQQELAVLNEQQHNKCMTECSNHITSSKGSYKCYKTTKMYKTITYTNMSRCITLCHGKM